MKKVSQIFKEKVDLKLKDDLNNHPGVLVLNYSGVESAGLTELRKSLNASGAKLFITKNKFSLLAFKNVLDTKITESVAQFIDGPVGLVFIQEDPVATCKALTEFAKTYTNIKLKGGYLKEQIINKQDFKIIANIPPRQVLYQQIAIGFNAPIAKLATSLNQIIAKLAYSLKDLIDKKQKQ